MNLDGREALASQLSFDRAFSMGGGECCIQDHWRKPCSCANTIAWARVHTPSLSKRLEVWLRTVFSLMERRSAISLFARPSAIRARISRSRGERDSKRELPAAAGFGTFMKSSTASQNRDQAGSFSSRIWLAESSGCGQF